MTATRSLSWQPSAQAARQMLAAFALGGGVIGVVGFSVSFWSVATAARPYMGAASWTLPLLVDLGIFVLSGLSLFLELHEISSKWIRLIPTALAGFTVYLNTATQRSLFGKGVHAAGPLLWVAVVEIGTYTVRRLVGLASESTMDKVRASRWLLAPASTFRLWRRMRLWETTSYRVAIGREHQMRASAALLREWHGPRWRRSAPSAQRLAVALQASTDRPVAELLAEAAEGIMAAARAAAKPAEQDPQTVAETVLDGGLRPLDPVLYPAPFRPVLVPFTGQAVPFSGGRALTPLPGPSGALENGSQNAENERDAAVRMRREGLSLGVIADRLGRSKSWVHGVVTEPVTHANGSAA